MSQQSITLNAARAAGLALDEAVPLECTAAGTGAIKSFSTWQTVVATVAADIDRVLADAREAVAAYNASEAELNFSDGDTTTTTNTTTTTPITEGEQLPLRAEHAIARTGASAAIQRVAALEKFATALAELTIVSRDVATASLLDVAEDFAGEIKGGAREVRVADETFIAPAVALISPAAPLLRTSPFVRERIAGEMIIWSSLTGQKATRTRVIAGNAIEAELPKIVLATSLNSAARVSTTLCAAHQPIAAAVRMRPTTSTATTRAARPKSGSTNKNKTEEAPTSDAAAAQDGDEKKSDEGEGKEGEITARSRSRSSRPATAEGKTEGKTESSEGKSADTEGGDSSDVVSATVTHQNTQQQQSSPPSPPPIPLRALGGWVHVEMFATTAPPKTLRGSAMTLVSESVGGQGARALALSLARIEHPAERNTSAAAATAVRVKWTLPAYVLTDAPAIPCSGGPRAPTPARWIEEKQVWTTTGVPEPTWTANTRALQFLTTSFSPHALVQPVAADWPYASWALTPAGAPSSPAVLLSIETARGFKVSIHISNAGCALVGPRLAALAWLTGGAAGDESDISTTTTTTTPLPGAPVLPPGELLALLDSAGIRLTPSDADVAGVNAILAAEAAMPLPPMAPALKGASRVEKEALAAAYEVAVAAHDAAPVPTLTPLLPASIEAALTTDLSRAAAAFTVSCVRGRGYQQRVTPADPDDAPPNAGAPILAEILFLETLTPAAPVGGHAQAWALDPTATLRMRVTDDPGARRGFKVQSTPEGVSRSLGDPFIVAPPFASIDECILQRASPEARAVTQSVPTSFTELLRRTLLLTRPLAFSA